ncbi:5'/3'-nucleotidase SurE [Nitrospina gracilis]|uniref:5'/3'-nucleotidase SurE n=1 Tax=Nitrospina gracilis TaxID=35801 RepID=UPI001F01A771|nr:5'/3'-nucleotidase SurE [Nitrospina gracilis]MCF8720231.1 5'-nucleotidase [Nitrospina gracilis Nb-211]
MIVLTNDDGFYAAGIQSVWRALQPLTDVIIVAPESEQSAVGHAITLASPLKALPVKNQEHGLIGYAVTGTPADCVKIAVTELLDEPPAMVISGVNHGGNVGTSIIYSGTVSAATEAATMGLPAIAVSLDSWESRDFSVATEFIRKLYPLVLEHGLPEGVSLNVNIPAVPREKIKGVAVTRQGKSRVIEKFDKRVDPRNNIYYWLAGEMTFMEVEPGTDCEMVRENYISVTPIHYDLTRHDALDRIKEWKLEF